MRKSKAKTKAKSWPKIPAEPKAEPAKPTIKVSVKYKAVCGLMNSKHVGYFVCEIQGDFMEVHEQVIPAGMIIKLDPKSKQAKRLLKIGAIEEA